MIAEVGPTVPEPSQNVTFHDRPSNESARVGLCFTCVHGRRVESLRGAQFYRCGYSDVDPSFAKYPQLPVRECAAYEQVRCST